MSIPGKIVTLPPFALIPFSLNRQEMLDMTLRNPNPTDVLLDASVFSRERIPLAREILLGCSPVVLAPVLAELQDLQTKAELTDVRDLVFPGGSPHWKFRGDDRGVMAAYPRVFERYVNILRWRRQAIATPARRVERQTGQKPVGKARSQL